MLNHIEQCLFRHIAAEDDGIPEGFDISENCTVYVTVTGKDGKTTTKGCYPQAGDIPMCKI